MLKNADSLNLIQAGQKYDVLQSSLGVMVGYPLQLCNGSLFNEIHVKWLYDLHEDQIKNTSRFSGGGPSFTTLGLTRSRSELNAGVSTTLFTPGNLALNASYDFNYRHHYTKHEGRLTATYKF
jgi:hypothetical protein